MLNNSQLKAKPEIKRNLLMEKRAKLQAAAGFGKTYLLRHLIDDLPFNNILMLAETNQAVNLLKQDFVEETSKKVSFSTICSALRYKLELTPNGYELVQTAAPNLDAFDLVIVDEGSQIPKARWEELKPLCKRILISGDSKQAPPIQEAISPVWAEDWNESTLTIPMRNQGDIFEYCSQLRDIVDTNRRFPKHPTFQKSPSEFERILMDNLEDFASGDAIYLALSEKGAKFQAVAQHNKKIKKALFGESSIGFWQEGERIVFKRPYVPFYKGEKVEEYAIFPNTQAVISSAFSSKLRVGREAIDAWLLNVKLLQSDAPILTVYVPKHHEDFETLRKKFWATRNMKMLEQLYSLFAVIQNSYAANVYVSQGLTKKKVFADLEDLTHCTYDKLSLRQRLFYVMCSRASHELYIKG